MLGNSPAAVRDSISRPDALVDRQRDQPWSAGGDYWLQRIDSIPATPPWIPIKRFGHAPDRWVQDWEDERSCT